MTDLTMYINTPTTEFGPILADWAALRITTEQAALLRERAIRLLAAGTAAALLDEALMYQTIIDNYGDDFWRLTYDGAVLITLGQLLADAARPAGPFKVDLIRREFGLTFEAIIEVLAAGPQTPSGMKRELGGDYTNVLSKMHEAGLIRYVMGNIELTPAGDRLA